MAISRRKLKIIRYLPFALLFIACFDFLLCLQSSYPHNTSFPRANDLQGTKSVFIASTQWNSGELLENHWLPNVLQVVQDLKAANTTVFVSIYENGSWDGTKDHLNQLRQSLEELQVPNEIVLDDKSHEQIIAQNDSSSGWLQTMHGKEMRRIPYLASVRNEALKPLEHLSASRVKFDKLLYINDVIFSIRVLDLIIHFGSG